MAEMKLRTADEVKALAELVQEKMGISLNQQLERGLIMFLNNAVPMAKEGRLFATPIDVRITETNRAAGDEQINKQKED